MSEQFDGRDRIKSEMRKQKAKSKKQRAKKKEREREREREEGKKTQTHARGAARSGEAPVKSHYRPCPTRASAPYSSHDRTVTRNTGPPTCIVLHCCLFSFISLSPASFPAPYSRAHDKRRVACVINDGEGGEGRD